MNFHNLRIVNPGLSGRHTWMNISPLEGSIIVVIKHQDGEPSSGVWDGDVSESVHHGRAPDHIWGSRYWQITATLYEAVFRGGQSGSASEHNYPWTGGTDCFTVNVYHVIGLDHICDNSGVVDMSSSDSNEICCTCPHYSKHSYL